MAERNTVEATIKVTTGASVGEVRRVEDAVLRLSRAMNDLPERGNAAGASIRDIAVGSFLGVGALNALERAAGLAFRGLAAGTGVIRAGVQQAVEYEHQAALLNAQLKASGQFSREYAAELQALASAQQRATTFTETQVLAVERQLAAVRTSRDEIPKLTKAILDLATTKGVDPEAVAGQFARAIKGQEQAVRRLGLVLDENATKQQRINQLIEQTNRTSEGAASAIANTYGGALRKTQIAYEDLTQAIGDYFVKNEGVITVLRTSADFFDDLTDRVKAARVDLKLLVTDALIRIVEAAPGVIRAVGGIAAAVAGLTNVKDRVLLTFQIEDAQSVKERLQAALRESTQSVEGVGAASFGDIPVGRLQALGLKETGNDAAAVQAALGKLNEELSDYGTRLGEATTAQDRINAATETAAGLAQEAATQLRNKADADGFVNAKLREQFEQYERTGKGLNEIRGLLAYAQREHLALGEDVQLSASRHKLLAEEVKGAGAAFTEAGNGTDKQKNKLAELRKTIEEKILATQAEIRITEEGIAQGLSLEQIEARVAVAKVEAKIASEGFTAALGAEIARLRELEEAQTAVEQRKKKLAEGLGLQQQLQQQIAEQQALAEAYREVTAAGLRGRDAHIAVAAAVARSKDVTQGYRLGLDQLTRTVLEQNRELEKRKALLDLEITIPEDAAKLEAKLKVLQQAREGVIKLRDVELELEKIDIFANLPADVPPETVAAFSRLQRLQQDFANEQERLSKSTFNLGESLSENMAKVVEGIALGTTKGNDFFKAFGQALKATWADALSTMIRSKLQFDNEINANFLQEIPSIVAQGAKLVAGIWNQAMGGLSTGPSGDGSSSGSGFFGSLLGGAATLLSGLGSLLGTGVSAFGQLAGGGANLLSLGTAVAQGNLAGIVSNTSTLLSVVKGLASGFQTWSAGGSFAQVLNSATGGITGALTSTLQPVLGSLPYVGQFFAPAVQAGFTSAQAISTAIPAGQGAVAISGAGPALGTTSALSSLGSAATTAGVLAAVVGVIQTALLGANLKGNLQSGAFGLGTLRDAGYLGNQDWFNQFMGNFISYAATAAIDPIGFALGGALGGENQFASAQRAFAGEGDWRDYIATIQFAILNLPQLIVAAFASHVPTGGTATRVAFEGLLEQKNRKHESRRFAPFFGNVPVWQDGEWLSGEGTFDRSLGQDYARRFEKEGRGTFVEGLRDYIQLQGTSIGLGQKQIEQFMALGFAFKAVLGNKGGNDPQRNIATIAAMLGTMAGEGVKAHTAMDLLRITLARLGSPAAVLEKLGERFEAGKIDVEEYRSVFASLVDLWAGPPPTLEFDLSDKNKKGLKVAAQEIEEIRQAFLSLPAGVHGYTRAIELLDETQTKAGEQGVVSWERMNERLQLAVKSVEQLNPLVEQFVQTLMAAPEVGLLSGEAIDEALETFTLSAGELIRDTVTSAIVEGFLRAQVDTGVLAPFFAKLNEAMEEFSAGAQGPEELAALTETLTAAGAAAVASIEKMTPALTALGQVVLDVRNAFNLAKDAADGARDLVAPVITEMFTAQVKLAKPASPREIEATVESTLNAITARFQEQLREATAAALYDGFIESLNTAAIQPIIDRVKEASEQLARGGITEDQYLTVIAAAAADAKNAVAHLQPAIERLATLGADIAAIFANAITGDAASLATAIVRLAAAQEEFNAALDARIYALRNQGEVDPAAIRARLPDIEKEFRLLQLANFGTLSDVVGAAARGDITDTEMAEYLRRLPGGADEATPDERLLSLERMRELAEQFGELRIAAINAELAAEVRRHEETIENLREERQAIVDNYATQIELRETELDTLNEQLDIARKWQGVIDQTKDTILGIRIGSASAEAPGSRFAIAEAEFRRQQRLLNDETLSVDKRVEAAGKLNELGPQLLQLLTGAGIPQASEQYRVVFDSILAALGQAQRLAEQNAGDVESMEERALTLQREIKALNKEQAAALKVIDASIKREQDAIVAAQDRARERIEQVNEDTAGVLEWIRGQGNNIFQQKQDELKAQLAALGVTDISIESIQAASLQELQKIVRLLEEQGINVGRDTNAFPPIAGPGQFGITRGGQEALRGALPGFRASGDTRAALRSIMLMSGEERAAAVEEGGLAGSLVTHIKALFPQAANSGPLFTVVVKAIIDKLNDPETFQPALGFAAGGIVRRDQLIRVGEEDQPELILPLRRERRSPEAQRAFEDLVRREGIPGYAAGGVVGSVASRASWPGFDPDIIDVMKPAVYSAMARYATSPQFGELLDQIFLNEKSPAWVQSTVGWLHAQGWWPGIKSISAPVTGIGLADLFTIGGQVFNVIRGLSTGNPLLDLLITQPGEGTTEIGKGILDLLGIDSSGDIEHGWRLNPLSMVASNVRKKKSKQSLIPGFNAPFPALARRPIWMRAIPELAYLIQAQMPAYGNLHQVDISQMLTTMQPARAAEIPRLPLLKAGGETYVRYPTTRFGGEEIWLVGHGKGKDVDPGQYGLTNENQNVIEDMLREPERYAFAAKRARDALVKAMGTQRALDQFVHGGGAFGLTVAMQAALYERIKGENEESALSYDLNTLRRMARGMLPPGRKARDVIDAVREGRPLPPLQDVTPDGFVARATAAGYGERLREMMGYFPGAVQSLRAVTEVLDSLWLYLKNPARPPSTVLGMAFGVEHDEAAEAYRMVREFFPDATDLRAKKIVADALRDKFDAPFRHNRVLGFADGALVRGEMTARVGEGNRPELILPLDRALHDTQVRRALGTDRLAAIERDMRQEQRRMQQGLARLGDELMRGGADAKHVRPVPAVQRAASDQPTSRERGDGGGITVVFEGLKLELRFDGKVDGKAVDEVRRQLTPEKFAQMLREAMKTPSLRRTLREIAREGYAGMPQGT